MKGRVTLAIAALLGFGILTSALADDQMTMPMGPKGDTSASSKAFDAAMMKMHKDMNIHYSGNADVDFVKGMMPHHQGAIDMAKVELQYGKDPKLRQLAQDIVKAQEAEIAMMKTWLNQRGK